MSGEDPQPVPAGQPTVVVWGTYDLGKPRVRILLRAARSRGMDIREIHVDVWRGVEDKSQIRGVWRRLRYLLRWLTAYPLLLARYLSADRHDLVFIPYMGHLDVIVLRPFARLRGVPIVWDALLSLHGTLVEDRGLVAPGSLPARLIRRWDRLAFACADQLITGTAARAGQYLDEYRVDARRITPIYVATELDHFRVAAEDALARENHGDRPRILFYGQFSPLHGLPTVLRAAASDAGRQWDWVFIGTGQEGWQIGEWLCRESAAHARWIHWVPYRELPDWIRRADVCLGTFGSSRKARTGISNKIFQILACGRPLVTADTPAVRELLAPDMAGVYLVPVEDADALAAQLRELWRDRETLRRGTYHRQIMTGIAPDALAGQLAGVFDRAIARQRKENVVS